MLKSRNVEAKVVFREMREMPRFFLPLELLGSNARPSGRNLTHPTTTTEIPESQVTWDGCRPLVRGLLLVPEKLVPSGTSSTRAAKPGFSAVFARFPDAVFPRDPPSALTSLPFAMQRY